MAGERETLPEPASDTQSQPVTMAATWRRSRAWRVASALLAAALIAASSYYVVSKLSASWEQVAAMHLRVALAPLLGSFAITLLCVLAGGFTWQNVLRALGVDLALSACTRTHLLANIAGYLPGYGWKYLGKAYLTQRQGVALRTASASVLVEFAGLAYTRAVVALSAVPARLVAHFVGGRGDGEVLPWLWGARVAAWVALGAGPWLFAALVRRGQRHAGGATPRGLLAGLNVHSGYLGIALVSMCLTWLLFGVGLAVLFSGLQPLSAGQFVATVFSASASFLVSLLAFFVPGGLSVRESVIIYTLEGFMPAAVVTVGALVSRGVLIAAEVAGAALGMALPKRLGEVS